MDTAAVLSIPVHPGAAFWASGPCELSRRAKAFEAEVRQRYAIAADLQACHLELPGGRRPTRADIYPWLAETTKKERRDPSEIDAAIRARIAKKKDGNRSGTD